MSGPYRPIGSRQGVAAVAMVFLLALAVRAWQPEHLGLGHYDEGVYALSASAVVAWPDGDLFPGQTRFSPPLWFATVGAVARVLELPPHVVALTLNVLTGALIAAAAATVGMAWFGMIAGVATGIFVALDPLNLMLSRSGLTDPAFAFWFLLAVAALGRALARGGAGALLLAGACTGLAWNTKYHGWFVLLIGAGAIILRFAMRRRGPTLPRFSMIVRRLGLVTVLAAMCYVPWALYMRTASGGRGLAGIVAYYLTLIGGDWFGRALEHVAMQGWLDGPLVRMAAPLAIAAALLLAGSQVVTRRLAIVLLGLVIVTLLGGGVAALVLLALFGLRTLLQRFDWPAALVISWLVLWLVAAPFYEPYARLLLPLMVVLGIAAGVGVQGLADRLAVPESRAAMRPSAAVAATLAIGALLFLLPAAPHGSAEPWRDARGSERTASWLDRVVPPGVRVSVVGEPSIAYYLHQRGRPAVAVVDELASLDTASTVTWVAAGRYARQAPPIRTALEALGTRRERAGERPIDPNDLRLLDDLSPARARAWRQRPDDAFQVVLYRVAPAAAPPTGFQAMRP